MARDNFLTLRLHKAGSSAFQTSPTIDVVVGEAGEAYREKVTAPSLLDRFTRAILFVKPDFVVVFDRLVAREPATFEYWLHATDKFDIQDQRDIRLSVKDVNCNISLLAPAELQISQTDQYDPNPRPRITLREWHLTAQTPRKTKQTDFLAVLQPYRAGGSPPAKVTLETTDGHYKLTARLAAGPVTITMPAASDASPDPDDKIIIQRHDENGVLLETVEVE